MVSLRSTPSPRRRPMAAARRVGLWLVVALGIGVALWSGDRSRKPAGPAEGTSQARTSDGSRYVPLPFPDGFVLDRVTRLVWNRCPLGTQLGVDDAGPLCQGEADWLTYKFAEATAKRFASYGDAWRLPTIEELKTLPVTDRCCHTLDPVVFPVMQDRPDRLTLAPLLNRYAFHSTNVDEGRRLSWRLDVATGQALEIALREEAFVRLVRNATEEELRTLANARPMDQSQRAKADTRLTPPPRPRSAAYLAARTQAIGSGAITGEGCNDVYRTGDELSGCLNGVQANVLTRYREGAQWADTHRPAGSYGCVLDDPVANMGCFQHFRKYLGDTFPDLPETTTTAECKREVDALFTIGGRYQQALHHRGSGREEIAKQGAMQSCRIYDEAHAEGKKVQGRPGLEGGPSPY